MCEVPSYKLKSDLYPPHLTSTYTCGVTTAPRVRGGLHNFYNLMWQWIWLQRTIEYIFDWFFFIGNISLQFSCCKFYNVSSIFVSLMSLITSVTISVWSQICYNFSIFSTKKNHSKMYSIVCWSHIHCHIKL